MHEAQQMSLGKSTEARARLDAGDLGRRRVIHRSGIVVDSNCHCGAAVTELARPYCKVCAAVLQDGSHEIRQRRRAGVPACSSCNPGGMKPFGSVDPGRSSSPRNVPGQGVSGDRWMQFANFNDGTFWPRQIARRSSAGPRGPGSSRSRTKRREHPARP